MNTESVQGEAMLASPQEPATAISLWRWYVEGVRAGLFLRPQTGSHQPKPWQLLVIVITLGLLYGVMWRIEIDGPATVNLRGWLIHWWDTAALLFLAWWVFPEATTDSTQDDPARLSGLVSWFALSSVALVPMSIVVWLNYIVQARALVSINNTLQWLVYVVQVVLMLTVTLMLTRRYGVTRLRLFLFAIAWLALVTGSLMIFRDRPWWPDSSTEAAAERPRLILTQEAFEKQQQVWNKAVSELAKKRPGVTDVYGLVFAPYASEDVFMRDSNMVAGLLRERFDAQHRVLQLVNNARTLDTLPWATPLNLERAIQAIAAHMDRDQDVLFIYLTSHGASNFKLVAEHWPLEVDALSPAALRSMLDRAGIRNRVIAISACYSGGWIDPLASETTLVMTAANAERTSYGCGSKSELTYFGRAVFDEQLRHTYSFEQAFQAARPVIEEREKQAGKKDGYSDPQIRIGAGIRPILQALEKRLARSAPAPVTAADKPPGSPIGKSTLALTTISPTSNAPITKETVVVADLSYAVNGSEPSDYTLMAQVETKDKGVTTDGSFPGKLYPVLATSTGQIRFSFPVRHVWDDPRIKHPLVVWFYLGRRTGPSTSSIEAMAGPVQYAEQSIGGSP